MVAIVVQLFDRISCELLLIQSDPHKTTGKRFFRVYVIKVLDEHTSHYGP